MDLTQISRAHRRSLGLVGLICLVLVSSYLVRQASTDAFDQYDSSGNLTPPELGVGAGPVIVDGKVQWETAAAERELDRRLEEWLARPVLSHEQGLAASRHGCPLGTFGREEFFFHNAVSSSWSEVDADGVFEIRKALLDHVGDIRSKGHSLVWRPEPARASPKPSRGVLYSGAYGAPLERLKLSLHMLKGVLRSELPVEIFHFDGENIGDKRVQGEIRARYGEDIGFVSLGEKHAGKNFQVKHLAFIHTSFTHSVWMDSDNLPLLDPAELFDSREFAASGAVFWPDVCKDHPDNAVWRILGMACSDRHWPAETGQIVFDKSGNGGLNLAAVWLALGMMEQGQWWGKFGWGDKDTFRYAFYILGLPYEVAPRVFTAAGTSKLDDYGVQNGFCGKANLHYGLTPLAETSSPSSRPRPAFFHFNVAKQFHDLSPDDLCPQALRPVNDSSINPGLVKTPSYWTGCLEYEDKEGDGLEQMPFEALWKDEEGRWLEGGKEILEAVVQLRAKIVEINRSMED